MDRTRWVAAATRRHDSCTCATWLIHTRDMTHSYIYIRYATSGSHSLSCCCHEEASGCCVPWMTLRANTTPRKTWLTHMRDMTHSQERHDSFTRETWLIYKRDMTHPYISICSCAPSMTLRANTTPRKAWLIHMRDMTHSYERHDSFIWETWLNHMRDVARAYERSHWYERHDSFVWKTWLICMRDMTYFYERHALFLWETWLMYVRDMTHLYERHYSYVRPTQSIIYVPL